MDSRSYSYGGSPHGLAAPPLPERTTHTSALPPLSEAPSPRGSERASAGNLRSASRSTVRAVTPEPAEAPFNGLDENGGNSAHIPRGVGPASPHTSPRSIPSAAAAGLSTRRQGVVFNDAFPGSLDSASTSPPPRPTSFRPRTHTMDGAFRQQLSPSVEPRNRMGSFSSAASLPASDDLKMPSFQSPFETYKQAETQPPVAAVLPKDKKASGARSRLTKRSSRPSSPLSSLPPSVDSLPLPIPTTDANKVLLLMKNLCGRMRGEVEFRKEVGGPWLGGLCYIEEERGSLMLDPGDSGPFHTVLVPDLRGCRVVPVERSDEDLQCLEIASPQLGVALLLRPLVAEELDLWLAALLCWQQLRPPGAKPQTVRPGNAPGAAPARMEMKRRVSSPGLREPAIIKVGKVMLWDKGAAVSPRAIVRRPSTRDLRSSQTCWRRVSCILHDNGELKIMTENDVTVLSVIELSQLARSAIQQLDKSVLDEEYCLAIFPTYSSTSTQLSIFRPVYIALETRVLFEVWFALLRAFAIPDLYTLDPANGGRVFEVTDLQQEPAGETFRLEKTISVRVTEAKLRSRTWTREAAPAERNGKGSDPDALIGNYHAEVLLDGEVRARTTTKMETKNPFWREDCEFTDLPAPLPYLSILLKRVDETTEGFAHHIQATLGLSKAGSLAEVLCGSVDIPLQQLDRGKDHEQWLQICDERQQSIGSMLLRVHHEEFAVLLQRHYQPLSELLHRFGSGLTAQITEALPGSLRRLAEIFVNIFQASESTSEWIMSMVEEEIDGIGNKTSLKKPRFSGRLKSNDSAESTVDREQIVRDLGKSLQGEANLLFRGNSLLTQALEFHMRRMGREYLTETLADKISEINESDSSCEVDPSKLHHGEDIQEHWNQLIRFTTDIWDCIASSAHRLPPELRHIFKYIRAVAEDRYGEFLRTVTYTSVSGFLFLRFLCPAILNPKLFGLLRDHPRPRAQRTLTLIAKSLQALANLSSIGKKETWMEPMNRFLTAQRQAFKDFLDAVCAIPAERTKTHLPAPYSTPTTILGRLSPMAREGFPSLPYLIDQGRNFAALVKLWADANPATASESQIYEGDLLKFHTLCLDLHQRSINCLARIEALRHAETAAEENVGLPDAMDRMSIGDVLSLSAYGGNTSAWPESEGPPPGSSGSDRDPSLSPPFGTISISRDPRHISFGRDLSSNSLRQASRSSEVSATQAGGGGGGGGGTTRSLRNGIHPRKLLSGFIRKTRMTSPDSPPGAGPTMASLPVIVSQGGRERDTEVDQENTKDHGKG
ncbi:a8fdc41f-c5ef-4e1b-962f-90cae79cb056 [Thermothielavioides terrestris]|uniref:A8fdc41f-c5ef-4e1b-962f-90cae79cb056 n=1 Tax=Thermothielavioides terrestris TaxID=2587410 RepID=A0A3S4BQM1_9PEZI|nr:a8fdc41f-c5ef-4e1b-962f-90cae79cb056 [Thermothielavioides terrestris]